MGEIESTGFKDLYSRQNRHKGNYIHVSGRKGYPPLRTTRVSHEVCRVDVLVSRRFGLAIRSNTAGDRHVQDPNQRISNTAILYLYKSHCTFIQL